jgi:hypothetical protein
MSVKKGLPRARINRAAPSGGQLGNTAGHLGRKQGTHREDFDFGVEQTWTK